jgi:hypothetical protein
MIVLTEEQARALEEQQGPIQVVHPRTQARFVLVPQDVYEQVCKIVDGPNRRGWSDPADDNLIRKKA